MNVADRMARYRKATTELPWDGDRLPMVWSLGRQLAYLCGRWDDECRKDRLNADGMRLIDRAIVAVAADLRELGAQAGRTGLL
jgi:hypothetical protein